jgi:CubicO group peptidase (beta-lactamase class C family)
MEVGAGRINLDAPIGNYLPEWNSGPQPDLRSRVTIRHLLTHTSGLPGHVTYYQSLKSKREIIRRAVSEQLVQAPGEKCEYSDPGFILLGSILETLTGRSLDFLAQQQIFAPLEMNSTMFNPSREFQTRIAPTGSDSPLRKGLIKGEPHDDNTFVMGGIAGHAGLFSTAGDLAAFCQMMLNGGIYAHYRLLKRITVEEFTSAQPLAKNARALGWVVPTEPSASGKCFSSRSFGHAGFTGTSIWCDPEKDLFVILLTNRVHPVRTNEKIQQVRPLLHDAIAEALGFTTPRASSK